METFSKTFSVMLFVLLAMMACVVSQDGIALDYIVIDNGYRWDKISNRATLGGPTITIKGSTQLLRKINSYQLGLRAQQSFCDCGFIRGGAHYGWVCEGNYSEGGFFGDAKGHTYDFEGAFGCYICLTPRIWVAPLLGWSYDALRLEGTSIKTAINGVTFHLREIKAHQKFNGPFIGFDLVYQVCDCYDFTFGYEFHFARWHSERSIQGRQYGDPPFGATTGFSNNRHIDHVYGQVFKLDFTSPICDCWMMGLGLKYQFFNGDFGKYKRTRTPLISPYTFANVDGLWWRSFGCTLYFGRMF